MSRLNLDPVISVQFEPIQPDSDPAGNAGERFRDHLETPAPHETTERRDSQSYRSADDSQRTEQRSEVNERDTTRPDEDRSVDHSQAPNSSEADSEQPRQRDNDQRDDDQRHEQADIEQPATIAEEESIATDEDRDVHVQVAVRPAPTEEEYDALIVAEDAIEVIEVTTEVDAPQLESNNEEAEALLIPATTVDQVEQIDLAVDDIEPVATDDEVVSVAEEPTADESKSIEVPASVIATESAAATSTITTHAPDGPSEEASLSPRNGEASVKQASVKQASDATVAGEAETLPTTPEKVASVPVAPSEVESKKESSGNKSDRSSKPRRGIGNLANKSSIAKVDQVTHSSTNHVAAKEDFKLASVVEPNLTSIDAVTDQPVVEGTRDAVSGAKAETSTTLNTVERGTNTRLAEKLLGPSATRQEGKVELRHVDQARFVQRVAGALARAGNRDGEIHLRLSPPELGSLRLQIKVEEGTLTARLEAENSAARGLLLENLPMLRERLAEQNIRIERFEVELSQHDQSGADQSGRQALADERHSSGNQRNSKTVGEQAKVADNVDAPGSSEAIAEKQINVVI